MRILGAIAVAGLIALAVAGVFYLAEVVEDDDFDFDVEPEGD
jgi:hypothetical protein